ncbi:GNAT family N-acetyltransferase [uncultured Maribacter sp.]|uniref:GNAT family N-acetyltransferase n=1 Tax=uncultured Maribacter sp. TaxID=431308 RepID=UPI0026152F87|nr:GNAT family N-acetyltransferase [uncultured Maribacter sp.]
MEKGIIIKPATLEDAVSIALLGRITFTETFGNLFSDKQDLLEYLDRTFAVDKIKKGIGKNNNAFFVAFIEGLPVGYGKLKLNSENEFLEDTNICQLQKIYVLSDFLSLGIGKKLHKTLILAALEKGYEAIWLSALDSNQRAIDFYKNYGYLTMGKHGYSIGKNDFELYVMYKQLK